MAGKFNGAICSPSVEPGTQGISPVVVTVLFHEERQGSRSQNNKCVAGEPTRQIVYTNE